MAMSLTITCDHIPLVLLIQAPETAQDMFITPLYQQHASHTLGRMDPSHTCGVNLPQDHT